MTYARGTSVDVHASQQEIARILTRYKVETYTFGQEPGTAVVAFKLSDFPVRIAIPLPARPTRPTTTNPQTGRTVQALPRWEQEVREAWRALVLLIKANLEAVERGIVRPEQAFMAYLVAPGGRTVGDVVLPAYRESLTTGRLELTAGATW